MTGQIMQINMARQMPDVQAWLWARLLMVVAWLVDWCGQEMVQPGWRQIPDGHQSFDPALADYFRTLKMRNGKHINLAVSYSVVAKWNKSNKRRGQSEWTYGSDRHYAAKYTDVDRKTWGQHMEELAALGLVEVSQIKGKPAYKAVGYTILNDQLVFPSAQRYGHDAQGVARDAQGYGHDAHPITEESLTEESLKRNDLKPSPTPARDADADGHSKPDLSKKADDQIPMPPVKVEAVVQAPSMRQPEQITQPPPTPPVPPAPPFPDEDATDPDGCSEIEALKTFFTGCNDETLKDMVKRHGLGKIYATIKGVTASKNVENPPGLVRWQLDYANGGKWEVPKTLHPDVNSYITGEYADFIQH